MLLMCFETDDQVQVFIKHYISAAIAVVKGFHRDATIQLLY